MQYPAVFDLPRILKGQTYDPNTLTYKVNGVVYDLTGCVATLTIKHGTTTLATLTSTPAAGITLGGTAGTISIRLEHASTTALTACNDASWELELLLADTTTKRSLAYGRVSIVEVP